MFGSWRGGGFSNIYVQEPGRPTATRLTDSPDMQLPTSITPDGSTLVFHSFTKRIEALPLNGSGDTRPFAVIETPQEERNAVVSPDGRWLAYEAETLPDSGQLDVFVRPFPDVDRGLWQVSTDGGVYPVWSPTGGELFYQRPDGTVVATRVEATAGTWRHDSPVDLFHGLYFRGDGSLAREYDVAPDGGHFLMLKPTRAAATGPPRFVVVQHWAGELNRLLSSR